MLKGTAMAKEFGAGLTGKAVALPTYADRVADETARIGAIKAKATPPEVMGAAPVAPAAGPKALVPEYEVAVGGLRRLVSAHWRGADVFDQMEQDALRAYAKTGTDAGFAPPFSPGQIEMARYYLVLTERHSAGGMRCASLEAGQGGGRGGEFIDAYISEGKSLRTMQAAIGSGAAMAVRRVRPSARGQAKAGIITDRALVDAVCLGQQTLNAVLASAGWSRNGRHREALRKALAGALDRMQGYKGTDPAK